MNNDYTLDNTVNNTSKNMHNKSFKWNEEFSIAHSILSVKNNTREKCTPYIVTMADGLSTACL